MNKRFIVFSLILTMLAGTINSPAINSYALEYNDNSIQEQYEETTDEEEKEENESEAVVETTNENTVWDKLEVLSDSLKADDNTEDELKVTVAKDDAFVFIAESAEEKIELILSETADECVVVYSTENVTMSGVQKVDELADSLNLGASDIPVKDAEVYTSNANMFFVKAMTAWDEMVSVAELTLGDLGFIAWEKYLSELIESNKDQDELGDDNGNIEEKPNEEIVPDADSKEETIEDSSEESDIDDENAETDENEASDIDEESDETDKEADIIEDETEIPEEDIIEEEELDGVAPLPSIERIATNYDHINIKVGEKIILTAKVYPENVVAGGFYWSTSTANKVYIDVDPLSGEIKGLKPTVMPVGVDVIVGGMSKTVIVEVEENKILDNYDEEGNPSTGKENGYQIIKESGIWVGGFERLNNFYDGKPVTQELRVYCKGELLTLNKDYSLSYKNNINVCDENSVKAASVTVTMKGQYSGKKTLFYRINPADINNAVNNSEGICLNYNKREQKLVPNLTYKGKKLVNNKDFYVEYYSGDYKGDANTETLVKAYIYGKGNYESYIDFNYYINGSASNNLSKAVVTCKPSIVYDKNTALTAFTDDNSLCSELDLKIKMPGSKTAINPVGGSDFDIAVSYPYGMSGTATITITGKNSNFRGTVKKTFKITPGYRLGAGTTVGTQFKSEIIFNKDSALNKQDEATVELFHNSTKLILGTDYTVEYANYSKVGTAKMIFRGKGMYSGTFTKTYKLLADTSMSVSVVNNPAVYEQGGTKNKFTVKCNGDILVENVDYTVRYTNNNSVGTASYTITGKGNYAKMAPVTNTFNIIPADISTCTVTVADKAYIGKPNTYKSVPTLTAPNGKKLVAGKDYDKNIEYLYDDYDDPGSIYYNNPKVNGRVMVKITATGSNYTGTVTGAYIMYDGKTKGMNKLFVAIDDQEYTGKPVEIDVSKDVHIYTSAADMKKKVNEIYEPWHVLRVVSYKNNINSGTATVVFGTSLEYSDYNYGGFKTCKFKIKKKAYDNFKPVTGISLDKTAITLKSTTSLDSSMIMSVVAPADATNQNVTWVSSNPNVVQILPMGNYCLVGALANGSSVVTATTQDGAKVAKCTVTSVCKPIQSVVLSSSSLNLNLYDTANLTATIMPSDAYVNYSYEWKSSNTSAVTVDGSGKVKAVGPGDSVVTYTINGKVGKCNIHVDGPKPIEKIIMSDSELYMSVSDTYNLSYNVYPTSGFTGTITWSSDNTSVATVASDGKVTAVAGGAAVIKAQNEAGIVGRCIVHVKKTVTMGFNIVTDGDLWIGSVAPDDNKDDRVDIRKAVLYVYDKVAVADNKRVLFFPNGTYDISSHYNEPAFNIDQVGSTLKISMSNKTVIKAKEDSSDIYMGFIRHSDEVTMQGGTLDGNLEKTNDGRDEAVAITMYNSTNITFDGVTFKDMPGDTFSVFNNDTVDSNILYKNCVFIGNTKNFLSLKGINGMTFENCRFYDAGGNAINIVPLNDDKVVAKNIKFINCSFEGNGRDFYTKAGKSHTDIDNISFDKCSFGGEIYIGAGKNITFTNTVKAPVKYYNAVTKSSVFPD